MSRHRKQLTGEVGDVADVDHLRLRRDRARDAVGQLGDVGRRNGEGNLRHGDLVAAHALIPRIEHPPVILVGRHHVIAGLEIESELADLQTLAGVARDRQLLHVAADFDGELAAHLLDVGLERVPHEVNRRLVRRVEIALQRLMHDAGAGARVPVVEVDDGAIEREGLLNVAPVTLIGCDVSRQPIGDGRARRHDAVEPVGVERHCAERAHRNHLAQEVASSVHDSLP